MMTILHAATLKPLFGVRHAFFGRTGGWSRDIYDSLNCGQSSDDKQDTVEENRKLVAQYLEAEPKNLISCKQIHSPTVITVIEPWFPKERPEADAMVTNQRGIVLGILTADCVPVLFADEKAGVIGAAHAGWRGAVGGVLENTVRAMEAIGADRSRITAALGPCIWQNSYEVGPEFPAPFLAEDPSHQNFFRPSTQPGYFMFDLPGYVEAKLKKIGVASIESSPADTYADEERFFSYRRNSQRGEKRVASEISTIMLIGMSKDKIDPKPDDEINSFRQRRDAQTVVDILTIISS